MSGKMYILYLLMVMVTMPATGIGPQKAFAAEKKKPGDMQVLASGPVHEAFAEAVTLDAEETVRVPQKPPVPIEEIPPSQKPPGDVLWIPGYWAWDDDFNDFIWVSGIWRVPPPGRQWIPGYWHRESDGYQWISGYWTSVEEEETVYLPSPPDSVEIGPNSNAPSSNYIWIPGCWEWYYDRYAWRTGYWALAHSDWIWIPDHYVRTPRGYIFVDGYWDYTIVRRGVMYAPVYFSPRVYVGLRYRFSPGFVIDLNVFDDALFLHTRYRHYYFGDYYAPKYTKRGIYPWFSLHAGRTAYDPIYAHQRWKHKRDHKWEDRLQKNFSDHRKNESLRPKRKFDHLQNDFRSGPPSKHKKPNFVKSHDYTGRNKTHGVFDHPLNETQRRERVNREKEVHIYRQQRQHREPPRQASPGQPGIK